MTIDILEKTQGCMPEIISKGDWIDLVTAKEVTLKAPHAEMLHKHKCKEGDVQRTRDVVFQQILIPLGVAMRLPKGMEAHIVPRSSTFWKYGLLQANSKGIIDCTYSGDDDEWKFPALATRDVAIPKGVRIAQFKVVPSQKATIFQKLRWLFSSGIKLRKVHSLNCPSRGGFGSTGF